MRTSCKAKAIPFPTKYGSAYRQMLLEKQQEVRRYA